MTTYQYVSNMRTDEVHLVPTGTEDASAEASPSTPTLCGRILMDPILGD